MTNLKKEVDQILTKQQITLTKILRLNNRFLVARGRKQHQLVTFKILISNNHYEQDKVGQSITREANFLNFLQSSGTTLIKNSVNNIIAFKKTEHSWYVKNFLPGKSQKVKGSGWLFNEQFFNAKNLNWLTNFYQDIYRLSTTLPLNLTKEFRKSNLIHYEIFLEWENIIAFAEIAKLPLKKDLGRIKRFLISHRKIFDCSQTVVNHFEPYADHIITQKNRTALIDWENVSYGDVAHDPAVIWLRAFNRPAWQKQLVKNFSVWPNFKQLFNLHVILQSLGNIRYFFDSPFYLDQQQAPLLIKRLQQYIKLALDDKII